MDRREAYPLSVSGREASSIEEIKDGEKT